MPKSADSRDDNGPGILRRVIIGSLYIFVATLAAVGLVGLLFEAYSWQLGTRWRPEEINAIISYDSPARRAVGTAWSDFKYLIQYGAYFIAAVALFIAVTQIKSISRLMRDYLDARGAIYQLAATMSNAEETARRLSGQADRLSQLEPTIQVMSEKVEEAVLKIGDLQRLSVSDRIDTPLDGVSPITAPSQPSSIGVEVADDDENWEKLREFWNANGARLDLAIERIPDKRKRGKFSRMDRRNYPAIINGLAEDNFISEAARKGSLDLHSMFVRYRPRSRVVPDSAIGSIEVQDKLLEAEFARFPNQDETAQLTLPVDNRTSEPA